MHWKMKRENFKKQSERSEIGGASGNIPILDDASQPMEDASALAKSKTRSW